MNAARFASAEWLDALQAKLNSDGRYAIVARKWEGDLFFDVRPDGNLAESVGMYLDLWHGSCRGVTHGAARPQHPSPKFVLTSQYSSFIAVLLGRQDPMTAMMTNRLRVDGNLAYMMRNVPTVLDFVRCAREIIASVV